MSFYTITDVRRLSGLRKIKVFPCVDDCGKMLYRQRHVIICKILKKIGRHRAEIVEYLENHSMENLKRVDVYTLGVLLEYLDGRTEYSGVIPMEFHGKPGCVSIMGTELCL